MYTGYSTNSLFIFTIKSIIYIRFFMASLSREVCICFFSYSEVSQTLRLLAKFMTMCSSNGMFIVYALVQPFLPVKVSVLCSHSRVKVLVHR